MKLDFVVNINDRSKGVSEQGFGLVLALDTENTIPYRVVSSAGELLDIEEVTVESKIYKIVQKIFMQKPSPQEVAVYGSVSASPTEMETALNELLDSQNNDWFSLVTTDNVDESITKLSAWALANNKIYYVTTQSLVIGAQVESKNTFIMYHNDPGDFVAEGLAAVMSVALPGSTTAKFEEIQGSRPANISLTEFKQLEKDNVSTYIRAKGRNYVSEGKTADGSYLDIVLGGYFIKFRLEEALLLLALNNKKIGYSDRGIGMQVAEIETVMKTATRQGIILTENGKGVYTITALRRSEMAKNKIANRVYDGASVVAVIDGAIHTGEVNIDLVLSEEE